MILAPQDLFISLIGGVLPALLWLWFWLKEDKASPEPRSLLLVSFILGMMAIPLAIFLEQQISYFVSASIFVLVIIWSAIEELLKYLAAYFGAFRKKDYNEPIDAFIYMVTVALGFAALENTLFIMSPLIGGDAFTGVITGNLRFVGASLLHVLTSGTIGVFIGLSFYKSKSIKRVYLFFGFVLATLLHALFNFFIMEASSDQIFWIFSTVWVLIIFLMLALEKVKSVKTKSNA